MAIGAVTGASGAVLVGIGGASSVIMATGTGVAARASGIVLGTWNRLLNKPQHLKPKP